MGRTHTSYDEIDTPAMLRADAAAAGRALHLPQITALDQVPMAAVAGARALAYDPSPREVAKREITVDEAAARIANALNLYLD
jgi:hypothetical protein